MLMNTSVINKREIDATQGLVWCHNLKSLLNMEICDFAQPVIHIS